jgi:hypothetical protein
MTRAQLMRSVSPYPFRMFYIGAWEERAPESEDRTKTAEVMRSIFGGEKDKQTPHGRS